MKEHGINSVNGRDISLWINSLITTIPTSYRNSIWISNDLQRACQAHALNEECQASILQKEEFSQGANRTLQDSRYIITTSIEDVVSLKHSKVSMDKRSSHKLVLYISPSPITKLEEFICEDIPSIEIYIPSSSDDVANLNLATDRSSEITRLVCIDIQLLNEIAPIINRYAARRMSNKLLAPQKDKQEINLGWIWPEINVHLHHRDAKIVLITYGAIVHHLIHALESIGINSFMEVIELKRISPAPKQQLSQLLRLHHGVFTVYENEKLTHWLEKELGVGQLDNLRYDPDQASFKEHLRQYVVDKYLV